MPGTKAGGRGPCPRGAPVGGQKERGKHKNSEKRSKCFRGTQQAAARQSSVRRGCPIGMGCLNKLPEEAVFSFPAARALLLETQLGICTHVHQLCRAGHRTMSLQGQGSEPTATRTLGHAGTRVLLRQEAGRERPGSRCSKLKPGG